MASIPVNRPLPPNAEASVFWRLRRRLTANQIQQTFKKSRLRVTLAVALSALLWFGLYVMFADGFHFLASTIQHPETHDQTVGVVFRVFFASLTLMLLFSSAVILYGSMYRATEAQFLLTLPARGERIFLHKFQEAMFFASWGFMLLGSPMLIAYGVVAKAPWYYYLFLPAYMGSFVYIPGSFGAIACILVIHRLTNRRQYVIAATVMTVLAVGLWLIWTIANSPRNDLLTPNWFQEMISRLQFSEHKLLPSWWLSVGLLQASRGQWRESVLFLSLTISNALFWHLIASWIAGRYYRAGYSLLHAERSGRRRVGWGWLDQMVWYMTGFLSREMRLLIVKDVRLFRRDPLQWSQFLIFFALLAMYFLNTRRLTYDETKVTWVNMISFLNLAVVGLILSTFTTRFIFPMVSLEGRRFWILGLMPVGRGTVLWSKFWFAACGSMIPCTVLVLLSDLMLSVEPTVIGIHLLICAILCTGLSGIAVGLGARMPNMREESPSKIAAGFGGTLNLVISAAYIVAVVLLVAVPCHYYLEVSQHSGAQWVERADRVRWWLNAGVAGSLALGVLATAIPLRMGLRAFRELEA
jgi:ABC-2 type transport system permease protein